MAAARFAGSSSDQPEPLHDLIRLKGSAPAVFGQ